MNNRVKHTFIGVFAAEVVPGLEAPQDSTQQPAVHDPSGAPLDGPSDTPSASRRASNKHASSSGQNDTAPVSGRSNGASSSKATGSNKGKQGSSNGLHRGVEIEHSGIGQQEQGDNGGETAGAGGGQGKLKEAVSVAGNKLQQAMQESGSDTASRSEFDY